MLLALVLACAPRAVPPAPPPAPPVGAPAPSAEVAAPSALPEGWRAGPTVGDLELTAADPSLGPADARFTIVSYADYLCPYCAALWPRLKELLDRNPDTRLVLKNYPLEQACNAKLTWEGHRFACLAAKAAECAAKEGRSRDMADRLYLYPDHVTPPEMPMFAEMVGLDAGTFSACLADPATDAAVAADIRSGVAAGVDGTPAVFVAGLEPKGWVPVAPVPDVIELAIAEARAGRPLPK